MTAKEKINEPAFINCKTQKCRQQYCVYGLSLVISNKSMFEHQTTKCQDFAQNKFRFGGDLTNSRQHFNQLVFGKQFARTNSYSSRFFFQSGFPVSPMVGVIQPTIHCYKLLYSSLKTNFKSQSPIVGPFSHRFECLM